MTASFTTGGIVLRISIAAFFFLLHIQAVSLVLAILFTTLCNAFSSLPRGKSKHHTAIVTLVWIDMGISITAFFLLHLQVVSLAGTVLFTALCNTFIPLPQGKSKLMTASFIFIGNIVGFSIAALFLLHIQVGSLP